MQRTEINEFHVCVDVTRDLLELRNLVQVADFIVRSAQLRCESRGLHFSRDYPELAAPAAATILVPPVAGGLRLGESWAWAGCVRPTLLVDEIRLLRFTGVRL